MYGLVMLGVVLVGASDFGPAPPDTLDPVARLDHLAQVFKNCDFSAVQTKRPENPNGVKFTEVTRILCKACTDATLLRIWVHMKDQVDSKGTRLADRTSFNERRWVRGGARYQLELLVRMPGRWPTTVANPGHVTIDEVVTQSPKKDNDHDLVWDQILVSDVVGDVDWKGITLTDMVSQEGRFGYTRETVTWTSADRSSRVAYRFHSAEYGTTTVTFTKVGEEWMPSQILIEKSSEHKVVPDRLLAQKNRLRDFREYDGFTRPTLGLDRYESQYVITYPSRSPLPSSIERTDSLFSRGERETITTTLKFDSLRAGGVSCDEVREAMLPIPDGRRAYVLDSDQKNIAWTTKDGKVIKKIDADAIEFGRTATFSSRPRLFVILTLNCLMILGALLLFRRRRPLTEVH